MEFKHGKIEARIKFPQTRNGLWPAFWMMGGDYPQVGWPKCGEIDIVEMGNSTGIKNAGNKYESKMYVNYVKVYQKGTPDEVYNGPALTGIKTPTTNRIKISRNPVSGDIKDHNSITYKVLNK